MGAYSKPAQLPDKWYPKVLASLPTSLQGQNILITGTTSGTGYAAAKVCAERGAKVIMLNRKSKRAEDALENLRKAVPEGDFAWVACDLQDFESVRQAAQQVLSEYEYLDVVALNAGVMALADTVTKDGYDVQMQTNVLSHFLLTSLLFPLLEEGGNRHGVAKIVNHTSGARFGSKLKLKYFSQHKDGELGGEASCLPLSGPKWTRYQQTKLACACFHAALTEKLAKRQGTKVISLLAHPGLAATNLQVTTAKAGGMGGTFTNWFMRFGQSANDGASPLIMAVAGGNCSNGDFYGPGQGRTAARGMPKKLKLESLYDNKASKELFWSACEAATGSFTL